MQQIKYILLYQQGRNVAYYNWFEIDLKLRCFEVEKAYLLNKTIIFHQNIWSLGEKVVPLRPIL